MMSRLLILSTLLLGIGVLPTTQAEDRPPNLVVILVDDLGWTDLGCAGSDLYETPNIDRLAAQGMIFNDAYSACTVCSPTRAAVVTGKYPARLNVTDWIHGHDRPKAKLKIPDWTHYLPKDQATIASALKPAGYVSISIGKWHLGDGPEHAPTEYGFDANIAGYGRGQPPSYFSPYNIPTLEDGPEGEYLTDREALEACRFIEANHDRPFLLYLPHYTVHTPLQAKDDLIEHYKAKIQPGMRHSNPIYAAMIHSLDESVGRIMTTLDDLDLADNTLVLFTSDNGGLTLRDVTDNAPLRAGKGSAYEGGVRVPFIARWPGVIEPGTTCAEPVMSIDILPTLLDAAKRPLAEREAIAPDGLSLLPVFRDPDSQLSRDALYWHYPHYHPGGATPYGAIRARDWKLLEFFEDDRVELYHLSEDLGESNDLANAHSERAEILRARLHAWRDDVDAQMPTPNPDYEP